MEMIKIHDLPLYAGALVAECVFIHIAEIPPLKCLQFWKNSSLAFFLTQQFSVLRDCCYCFYWFWFCYCWSGRTHSITRFLYLESEVVQLTMIETQKRNQVNQHLGKEKKNEPGSGQSKGGGARQHCVVYSVKVRRWAGGGFCRSGATLPTCLFNPPPLGSLLGSPCPRCCCIILFFCATYLYSEEERERRDGLLKCHLVGSLGSLTAGAPSP